ncbi:hypothetical protein ACFLZ2_01365 [Candidatus Margulisiibacteriota bacterium]
MLILVKELILSGGRTIMVLGALASLFLAIGYLFAPNMLKSMSGSVNRIFEIDQWMLGHRLAAGIVFLLVAVVLIGTLYSVK